MTHPEPPVPETSVLAIASHVVSGHVGNKIAVFVLQSLGCDVAALNTVQFSNHTGYKQVKGTRVSAQEITDLWDGLRQSHLDDFDMMLSGYVPGAAAVEAVGNIAKDLRQRRVTQRQQQLQLGGDKDDGGRFFWVLDPVMGDNGRLYVADDVVPAYRGLIPHADLILPNQFEAEILSEVKITDPPSLERAIEVLHSRYGVPHVVITSVSLPLGGGAAAEAEADGAAAPSSPQQSQPPSTPTMSVVGSSMCPATRRPRPFRIAFPVFDCYFSGTGDMFAALMVVRLREAVTAAATTSFPPQGNSDAATSAARPLAETPSWLPPSDVAALDLPLARAAEKTLASMHGVLARTSEAMGREIAKAVAALPGATASKAVDASASSASVKDLLAGLDDKTAHLVRSRAAEVRLARNLDCLRDPSVEYHAEQL